MKYWLLFRWKVKESCLIDCSSIFNINRLIVIDWFRLVSTLIDWQIHQLLYFYYEIQTSIKWQVPILYLSKVLQYDDGLLNQYHLNVAWTSSVVILNTLRHTFGHQQSSLQQHPTEWKSILHNRYTPLSIKQVLECSWASKVLLYILATDWCTNNLLDWPKSMGTFGATSG